MALNAKEPFIQEAENPWTLLNTTLSVIALCPSQS